MSDGLQPDLLCQRTDIRRDVLRFALGQRKIHLGMGIEQGKSERARIETILSADDFERRSIGDFTAWRTRHGVAGSTLAQRNISPVADVRGERCDGEGRQHNCDKADTLHVGSTPKFAVV